MWWWCADETYSASASTNFLCSSSVHDSLRFVIVYGFRDRTLGAFAFPLSCAALPALALLFSRASALPPLLLPIMSPSLRAKLLLSLHTIHLTSYTHTHTHTHTLYTHTFPTLTHTHTHTHSHVQPRPSQCIYERESGRHTTDASPHVCPRWPLGQICSASRSSARRSARLEATSGLGIHTSVCVSV